MQKPEVSIADACLVLFPYCGLICRSYYGLFFSFLLSFSLIGERISQQTIAHVIFRGSEVPTILTPLTKKTRKSYHLLMSL
jgi:hypothetical protein